MSDAGNVSDTPRVHNALVVSRQAHQSAPNTCLCASHREVCLVHSLRDAQYAFLSFLIHNLVYICVNFPDLNIHFHILSKLEYLRTLIFPYSLIFLQTYKHILLNTYTHIIDLHASWLLLPEVVNYSLRPKSRRYIPKGSAFFLIYFIQVTNIFFHHVDLL